MSNRMCLGSMFDLLWTSPCDDDGDAYEVENQFVELVPDTAGSTRIKIGDHYADTSSAGVSAREHADTDHQRWTVREAGTTTPPADTAGQVVRIENLQRDLVGCVTYLPWGQLRPTPCADVPEQKFQRVETAGGTVLRSVASGKCVSVGRINATPVDCDPASALQQWVFEPVKTGAFRLRIATDQRYLVPVDKELWVQDGQRNFSPSDSWVVTAA